MKYFIIDSSFKNMIIYDLEDIMKRKILYCLIILFGICGIGLVNGKVIKEQASQQEQPVEFEMVKKGDTPHLTIFYFGELQGFIAPCG